MSELEKDAKLLTEEELEKVTGGSGGRGSGVNSEASQAKEKDEAWEWQFEDGVKIAPLHACQPW